MSAQPQTADPGQYEEGFFSQNTWIRPVAMFMAMCFGILTVIIILNHSFGWLGGRFGQVLFGMVASMIFMAIVISTILLTVNATRYLFLE